MKKYLLFIIGCLCASIDALAYDYNVPGTINFRDDGEFQYVELETPGALSAFIQGTTSAGSGTSDNFNQYFQTSTLRPYVIFSGPMNEDDINIIKNNLSSAPWKQRSVLDFTNVTTDVAPRIEFGWNGAKLVIWPSCHEVTVEEQAWMSSQLWEGETGWAFYKNNDKTNLFLLSANFSAARGTAFINYLATLISNNVLSFNSMCVDYSEKADGTGWDYYNAYSNFVSDLANLPVENLDLHGLNISSLGKDFSGLNEATHYLVLPVNGNQYKVEDDFVSNNFTYGDNIYVVSAVISMTAPYGSSASFDGRLAKLGGNLPSSMTLTKVLQPGKLSGAEPYLTDVQKTAEALVVIGTINDNDLIAMNAVRSSRVDLNRAIIADGSNITTYENDYVEYLALPNNTRKEIVDNVYSKLATKSLKGVGAFTTQALEADGTYMEVPTNTLITYSKEQGSVMPLVLMLDETKESLESSLAVNVHNIIMSGRLNAYDICCRATENAAGINQVLGSDGHLYATGNLPEGVTQITYGALNEATLAMVDFTNAIFDQPSVAELTPSGCPAYFTPEEKKNLVTDMNLVALAINPTTKLLLPTDPSQIVIPAHFMSGTSNGTVESLCIPYNFQYIMDYAFWGCEGALAHIYTSKGAGDTNLVDGVVDHGVTYNEDGTIYLSTYTISSNVKYIAVGAFDTQTDCRVGDVYVLAQDAPICEKDAFNIQKYIGNNGFVNTTPVCRENYKNTTGDWITVLHFPNALDDEAKKKYTDIDRRYFLMDETGAVDGDGNPIVWPIHSEFLRSWNQALMGYTWKDWSENRCTVEQDGRYGQIFAVGSSDMVLPDDLSTMQVQVSYWDETKNSFEWDEKTYTKYNNQRADCEKCGFASYIGWHQFLLARSDYFYEHKDEKYKQTPWYSFCIPYNMTRDELRKVLGTPDGQEAEVRTLVAVKRNTQTHFIDVIISQDLVQNEKDIELTPFTTQESLGHNCMGYKYVDIHTTKSIEDAVSEDVYVKGGYPYFVRGWIPDSEPMPSNLGAYVLAKSKFDIPDLGNLTKVSDMSQVMYTKDQDMDGYVAMPFFSHTVDAIAKDYIGQDEQDKPIYEEHFYGNNERASVLPAGSTDELYKYNFVGNYNASNAFAKYIPAGTYYMSKGKIYRSTQKKNVWKPWICVISHNGVSSAVEKIISETSSYLSDYTHVLPDYLWGNKEYTGEEGNADAPNAAKFAIFFEEDYADADGMVTGVRNIETAETTSNNKKVYSISGQCVGTSTNGLQKGIYVINGKKVIVD